jgi:hypothetical protein
MGGPHAIFISSLSRSYLISCMLVVASPRCMNHVQLSIGRGTMTIIKLLVILGKAQPPSDVTYICTGKFSLEPCSALVAWRGSVWRKTWRPRGSQARRGSVSTMWSPRSHRPPCPLTTTIVALDTNVRDDDEHSGEHRLGSVREWGRRWIWHVGVEKLSQSGSSFSGVPNKSRVEIEWK